MKKPEVSIDELCVNTIRTLAIDMIQKANSGHPGLPLGAAPMVYVLWKHHLRYNPKDPKWPNRDRFILSAGHGSALLYSLLHLTGYDVSLNDLKSFRQWGSNTPGHPESFLTPGVEVTSGPLGQGAANAVGMAIAERALAARFNRPGYDIVDHYTYALVSDGDLMEGICAEASSLAGHLKLGKLVFLYDSNDVSLDGPTSLTFSTEDAGKRYEAYGWQVLRVNHGNTDLAAIDEAIMEAKADVSRPSLIIIKTTLGYGSPKKAGKADAHGSPLGEEEVVLTKKALGWEWDKPFHIPDNALALFRMAIYNGRGLQEEWQKLFDAYAKEYPEPAAEWRREIDGELPDGWDSGMPSWGPDDKLATRQASNAVLNAIGNKVKGLIGGAADLSISTLAYLKDEGTFDGQTGKGRNIYFGVREHAMAGIANGMAHHGGVRPFVSTFLVFSDYMRPSIRLAAMSNLPVIYIFSHDSVALGEDGPTHQPVEQLMSLRAIPNLAVMRPADANETAEAWRWAIRHKGPVAIVLTRQKLPTLDRSKYAPASGLHRGAYIISEAASGAPSAVIIATGSEVHTALKAQELLEKEGIPARVVSMPCWEAFEADSEEYGESVLLSHIKARVSVEAGVTLGWERWIGGKGTAIGVDRFGASAPEKIIMEKFGLTAENVVNAVRSLLS